MKIMKPIISFITPVYNNTRYLRFAIDSIINQVSLDSPIEIVIVDDGSTDGTSELVDEIALLDSRIKTIHQDNQWIYASFNNGINIASGEYIYILNSDDKLAEGAVETLLDSIKRYDYPDVIWTKVAWQNVDSDQNILNQFDMNPQITKDKYCGSELEVRDNWMLVKQSGLSLNQANLYMRKLALDHPFRNDYYAGDSFFNVSIARDITSMLFLEKPIYNYLAYNDSQLNASIGKFYGYEHRMFNELLDEELKLASVWDLTKEFYEYLIVSRMRTMSYEIDTLSYAGCKMTCMEKVDYIFSTIADSWIRELAKKIGREREYESRILTGTRKFLCNCGIEKDIPDYVSVLIRNLPENYLDNCNPSIDMKEIGVAIDNEKNVDKIGKIYFSTRW